MLSDLSLVVAGGEWVAVLGANGEGKTTLLRSLAGLLPGTRGSVLIEGRPLHELSPLSRAARIAYLPQRHAVPEGFCARQLVEMGRHPYRGESSEARRAAALQALDEVRAGDLRERTVETLSGGELQKVFLASVVAQGTRILLLDEPTVFLDPGRAREIRCALERLSAGGRTLIVATHDLDLAAGSATRVIGLRGGRVVLDGPPGVLTLAALRGLYGAAVSAPAANRGALASLDPPALEPAGSAAVAARGPRAGRGGAPPGRRRGLAVLGGIAICAVLLGAPFVGPSIAGSGDAGPSAASSDFILRQLRVPRVILAGLSGAALALAGAAFQALFRNPLATPYTLGVASGAALGAVLALLTGAGLSVAGLGASGLGALGGAAGITAAVYGIGRRRGVLSTPTLLLAGVTLSFFASAVILLLQYLADFTEAFRILRWLMGEVRIVGYGPLAVPLPLVVAGAGLVLPRARELNLLLTGEDLAGARGVDVERVKRRLLLGCSLLVAGVVAQCGPIGFVGLVVPHAVRGVTGPDHTRLLPACVPAGAAFLVACDTLGRVALAPAELPVGVVTALLGGPFFLFLLMRLPERRT